MHNFNAVNFYITAALLALQISNANQRVSYFLCGRKKKTRPTHKPKTFLLNLFDTFFVCELQHMQMKVYARANNKL